MIIKHFKIYKFELWLMEKIVLGKAVMSGGMLDSYHITHKRNSNIFRILSVF